MTAFIHSNNKIGRIVHGSDTRDVMPYVTSQEQLSNLLVITSPTQARSSFFQDFLGALSLNYRLYTEVRPHSPRACLREILKIAEGMTCDGIVAVGGGSVIDTAKTTALAMWRGIGAADDLDQLVGETSHDDAFAREPKPRVIAIPTTLSAAELTPVAGMLNEGSSAKEVIVHPHAIPRTIIYDPRALISTPSTVLLSTGMKALDHAIETLCAVIPNAFIQPQAERAVLLLARALSAMAAAFREGRAPDLETLGQSQLGCWMSCAGPSHGALVGCSHAISHALGAICGTPHGITSCITLPATMEWNGASCDSLRPIVSEVFKLDPSTSVGQSIRGFVSELGLPTRLADIDVSPNLFPKIAAVAFEDKYASTNCRPVRSVADILDILQLAQ